VALDYKDYMKFESSWWRFQEAFTCDVELCFYINVCPQSYKIPNDTIRRFSDTREFWHFDVVLMEICKICYTNSSAIYKNLGHCWIWMNLWWILHYINLFIYLFIWGDWKIVVGYFVLVIQKAIAPFLLVTKN